MLEKHGYCYLAWKGNVNQVLAILRSHGLYCDWDGNEDEKIRMQLPTNQPWWKQERRRERIEDLLKKRFGEVDEELAQVIGALQRLTPEEFTPLIFGLERSDLLDGFACRNRQI